MFSNLVTGFCNFQVVQFGANFLIALPLFAFRSVYLQRLGGFHRELAIHIGAIIFNLVWITDIPYRVIFCDFLLTFFSLWKLTFALVWFSQPICPDNTTLAPQDM